MAPQQISFDSERFSGTRGFSRWWRNALGAELPPRGLIVIVHGIGEHGGRYAELAQFFCQLGYDVLAPDLPGHGWSAVLGGQKRCYALEEITDELRSQVDQFVLKGPLAKKGLFRSPWFLLGHSLGGLIALNWIVSGRAPGEQRDFAERAFVSAPALRLKVRVPAWKEKLAGVLLSAAPDVRLGNGIDAENLSYDAANVANYRGDALVHNLTSARQYESIKRSAVRVIERASDVEIPLFLAVGADDPVIDPGAVVDFYDRLGTHKKILTIPSAKHEILNELNRSHLYREVAEWFLS